MSNTFDAAAFLARLQTGEFDGQLHQVIATLTHEQLEQVALLMAERLNERKSKAQGE